ncbi:Pyruvate/2-oxoglutarate dehydrogenase complex, dehydrogenase (E1) component, alpha subunit [Thermoproteus uzoniensis 768-20]|uniref:2-oxoacid oxidoreductase (ferredoxin) n=1 Tax=Thermoproteus uzoniensis (strain 768-20) TaxID=999630 RepID=F2L6B2_THEU7|nr:thiamine pyrophosphate-dependent dehydrogenase E1 component subunit alpha [Thermoproteus uzoniensis]AEA12508.1 Pyruvate/2-oxoglutarate dehydrogenase complex, dehydrogenase (E1) component, alpha subunit [Thermoproteus uzoniensis 768-20]
MLETNLEIPRQYRTEVKQPQIFRVLGQDGEPNEAYEIGYKPTEGELAKAYRWMVVGRTLDKYALMYHRMGKVRSTYGPHEGHEAADAGTALALRPEDWVAPHYRNLTLVIARGVPLEVIWAKFFAKSGDPDKGRNLTIEWGGFKKWRILSIGAPIGHQYVYAAGFAYALRYMKRDEVVAAYIGDGGTSTGGFHAGLNFAGVYKVPAAFFIYNNQYAISMPVARQTAVERLATKAAAYGIEGVSADGMDLLAVVKTAKWAVEKARRGEPALVEYVMYRFGPHTTADDPLTRYRDQKEVEEWRRWDPLARLERFLIRSGIYSESDVRTIWEEAEREVKEAAKAAEAMPDVPVEEAVRDVYSFVPKSLQEWLGEL